MPLRRLTTVTGILVAILGISFATSAIAGRSSKSSKGKPPETHQTTITTVSPTSITINEDKTPRTFTISQFTEVTVNGQHGTIADLKPGMNVSVTLKDPTSLSRITAVSK